MPRTLIGFLNFFVLQFFFVRLARLTEWRTFEVPVPGTPAPRGTVRIDGCHSVNGDIVARGKSVSITNCSTRGNVVAIASDVTIDGMPPNVSIDALSSDGVVRFVQREVTVGYRLLRWVWPLTGWWSPLRYVRTIDPFGMKRMPRAQLKLWMRDIGLQPKRWETYRSMRKRTQVFMRRV